ncbi:hypothetical protein MBLNU230_g7892t1 [Neophaeotheca triangularis]
MRSSTFPGLEVYMSANGHRLREYPDDDDGDSDPAASRASLTTTTTATAATTAYVQTVPNALFHIRVDGNLVSSKIYRPSESAADGSLHRRITGVDSLKDGRWVREGFQFREISFCKCESRPISGVVGIGFGASSFGRAYVFSDMLRKADAATNADAPARYSCLGEVELRFTRVRVLGPSVKGRSVRLWEPASDHAVPEKALKGRAISQRAGYAPPVPHTPGDCLTCAYAWGKEPFAKFVFKYRSRRDLQIEGIIPRSPSPTPLEDRDEASLTVEEARELVRRQRREKRDTATLVSDDESGDDDGDGVFEVERQGGPTSKRLKTCRDPGVEVVDLS